MFGVGGGTIKKLKRSDLHVFDRLKPHIIILEIETNDLSNLPPEIVVQNLVMLPYGYTYCLKIFPSTCWVFVMWYLVHVTSQMPTVSMNRFTILIV